MNDLKMVSTPLIIKLKKREKFIFRRKRLMFQAGSSDFLLTRWSIRVSIATLEHPNRRRISVQSINPRGWWRRRRRRRRKPAGSTVSPPWPQTDLPCTGTSCRKRRWRRRRDPIPKIFLPYVDPREQIHGQTTGKTSCRRRKSRDLIKGAF